jgi:hypothetical protein
MTGAPVPLYKQPRFVFATTAVVVLAGLLMYGYITDLDFKEMFKYIAGAFLSGAAQ